MNFKDFLNGLFRYKPLPTTKNASNNVSIFTGGIKVTHALNAISNKCTTSQMHSDGKKAPSFVALLFSL